ncbi:DSBA-like thioredoxin domain protein [compost metagenome]
MSVLHVGMSFDFTCPWSLIGKHNLDLAVQRLARLRPEVSVQVEWLGLQLLPEIPLAGMACADFYDRRLGGAEAARARQVEIQAAAASAGLTLALERIRVMPNTATAHRVFAQAARLGNDAQQERLLDRLFAAHFLMGEDIGQRETLGEALESAGYDAAAFADVLQEGVRYYIGRRVGLADISVPLFLVNDRPALVGARSAEQLLDALCRSVDAAPVRQERRG